jgi:hypothetical protein
LVRYLATNRSKVHRKHSSCCCVFTGTCIPSCCPATGICVTVLICGVDGYKIVHYKEKHTTESSNTNVRILFQNR